MNPKPRPWLFVVDQVEHGGRVTRATVACSMCMLQSKRTTRRSILRAIRHHLNCGFSSHQAIQ